MATNAKNCTIVGHTFSYYDVFPSYSTGIACYAGCASNKYFVYVLKFTTPDFAGVSESIDFNLWMYRGYGETVKLRYAICSSDANKNSYYGVTSAVTDPNQIKTGTVTFNNITTTRECRTISASTAVLEPNKTYYLMLWAYDQTGVELLDVNSAWGSYSVTLGYNSSVVWIDNGSSFEAYQCYIDNGTSWDLYIPYIDNGSSWEAVG